MTQLLFGLTVVFVVYVLYEVFKTVSQPASTVRAPAAEPKPQARTAQTAKPPEKASIAKPAPAESPKTEGPKEAPKKENVAAAPEAEGSGQLKNPQTGEVSGAPTNYRFAKKWIKDALVAEGLLDRVYKPAELDDATTQKVKEALDKFRTLVKYQA